MLQICVLASGSKGNAIYIESQKARILIDAGLSLKELTRRMATIGREPSSLDAVIVSHEHHDHISGIGPLSRKHCTPVFITRPTLRQAQTQLKRLTEVVPIEAGVVFAIKDIKVRPFDASHDAVNPVNFVLKAGNASLGIATDLGFASTLAKENLKGRNALIVETNHDVPTLENGGYPWPLKQRIKSKRGHLSNEQGAQLIAHSLHSGLKHLCLAHLSEENNSPDMALAAVQSCLGGRLNGIQLHVASQSLVGPLLDI